MVNLIPEKAKKNLKIEYWTRVISSWLILWAIALATSSLILLPTYVLIGEQISIHEDSAIVAMEKVAGYENVSKQLEQTSIQAKDIVDEDQLEKFSDYIYLLNSLQGNGVVIKDISLSRKEEIMDPIIISGVADNRKNLAAFRDRILNSEGIESVDLPIPTLASDKDIDFNISIVLDNKE